MCNIYFSRQGTVVRIVRSLYCTYIACLVQYWFSSKLQIRKLKMSLEDGMLGAPHFLNSELLYSDGLLQCRIPVGFSICSVCAAKLTLIHCMVITTLLSRCQTDEALSLCSLLFSYLTSSSLVQTRFSVTCSQPLFTHVSSLRIRDKFENLNPLKTKRRLLYLKTQFVAQ